MISRSPKRRRHGVVRTKGPIVRVSNSTSLRVMFMAAPHRADWCQNSLTRHPCGKVRNTSYKATYLGTIIGYFSWTMLWCSWERANIGCSREHEGRPYCQTQRLHALRPVRYRYGSWTQNLSLDSAHTCATPDAVGMAAFNDHHLGGPC